MQKNKQIQSVLPQSSPHWVGNGFPVRSIFNYNDHGRELSPFLLLDYAAPHNFSPGSEKRGVDAHPHKGFETVTIVYQGELDHRDSSGGGGTIGPGDVQWMTAGRGIIHEEFHSDRFVKEGGPLEMVQLWVNLRAADKNVPARYQTLRNQKIPEIRLAERSAMVRVIAGELQGHQGPAETYSPINLWDIRLSANSSIVLPIADGHTTAILILSGEVLVGESETAQMGQLIHYSRNGDHLVLQSAKESRILLLSGVPFDEPIVGQGPFVMNTTVEIKKAYSEFMSGKFGRSTEGNF